MALVVIIYTVFYISSTILNMCVGQYVPNQVENVGSRSNEIKIVWCTISRAEFMKCNNFAIHNERDKIKFRRKYFKLECMRMYNKDECMRQLDTENATLTTLDLGQMYVGGRYHSLVPIAQEILNDGLTEYHAVAVVKKGTLSHIRSLYDLRNVRACFAGVETYAGWMLPINTLMKEGGMEIIDCNNHIKTASAYFGSSCAVNSLTEKFNPIGDNSDKLCKLCIGRVPGDNCVDADPYAGYDGAFRCLVEAGDIAFLKHTTVKELISGSEFTTFTEEGFELLCKDGTRRPINDYLSCHWGKVPTDAIVTSSVTSFEKREYLQKFLEKAVALYSHRNNYTAGNNNAYPYDPNAPINSQPEFNQLGHRIYRSKRQTFDNSQDNRNYGYNQGNQYPNNHPTDRSYSPPYIGGDPHFLNKDHYGVNIDPYQNPPSDTYNRPNFNTYDQQGIYDQDPYYDSNLYETFDLFESVPKYGRHGNLLFSDGAVGLAMLPERKQTLKDFLGSSYDVILGVRDCPVKNMTLCVTSEIEQRKCIKMKIALEVQLLKPEMFCLRGHSQIHCMQAIRDGTADVVVLDAGDVYTAGLNFNLIPFMSEVYNLNDPEYYVVAVAKESDPDTELTYLRGKKTCHGGINTAAGWVYPLAFLLSNGWIRPYGCNSIRAAAEYFTKSCIPGALSTEYNTGVPYDNMCDLCHGNSFRYCRRDASEDYYGHTGAFRCLVEGGGQVAFVKHTTVYENTGGKRREWWARDNLNDDFELLCPDGTRAEINDYTRCNMGKVKANAIVTRGGYGYNETYVNAYINLFLYAQTYYGRKTSDEFSFSMFSSEPPYYDLIFQDATTQLKVIPQTERYYSTYLGKNFMRARRIVDCHAGTNIIYPSASIIFVFILIVFS